eukprot:scaffold14072_cov121-Isochrysis_galbana.AAC.4
MIRRKLLFLGIRCNTIPQGATNCSTLIGALPCPCVGALRPLLLGGAARAACYRELAGDAASMS